MTTLEGIEGFEDVLLMLITGFRYLWDAITSNWITAIFVVILFIDLAIKVIYVINGDGD